MFSFEIVNIVTKIICKPFFKFQDIDSGDNATNKDTSSFFPLMSVAPTIGKNVFIAPIKK